jgi:hypothetical protein
VIEPSISTEEIIVAEVLMSLSDVFLKPFMKDMAKLWNEGVCMWDQYQQEYFTLYAIIFICIHDAPGALHYQDRLKGRVVHVMFM